MGEAALESVDFGRKFCPGPIEFSNMLPPDIIRAQKEVGKIQTCRADLRRTPAEADRS